MQILKRSTNVFALLLFVLLGGAVVASAQVKQGTAVVKALSGSASYLDAWGMTHQVSVGTVLKVGQTLQTGEGAFVDLFLAENGPAVGINPNSVLRLERLNSWQSALGTLVDTRLDLQAGQLYGIVDKLLPGSRYEVKMPNGVAKVRGTTFYVDTKTGSVHVISGSVSVEVVLNGANIGGAGINQVSKTVAVGAGFSLLMPTQFKDLAAFQSMAPKSSTMSPTAMARLAQLGMLRAYDGSAAEIGFSATVKPNGKITIDRPPDTVVVSP
jgi:hypothetical protein